MNAISIKKVSIVDLKTDAIVNAANERLAAGGGVCGAIFKAAGHFALQRACNQTGHCATGSAVITPGFKLNAKYIIHAVGPIWSGGKNDEPSLLKGAYTKSLELALENGCRSVGFPLISAGIFGYPAQLAWEHALKACGAFLDEHPDANMEIVFAVLDQNMMDLGMKVLSISPAARWSAGPGSAEDKVN